MPIPEFDMPLRATMWHGESLVLTGNVFLLIIDAAQEDAHVYVRNGSNNGDSGSHGLYLAAGTYTFSVLGQARTNCGKVDWTLDGASIAAAQDWYAGTTTRNVVKIVAGVVVPYSGWHRLVMTMNGNTPPSSGFALYLTKYWFTPAAD
jgi:hypothetical protein